MKVVFHINESEKWSTVLKNIMNLLEEGKGLVTSIEVVANGEAILAYTETNNLIPMHELVEKGIRFSSCQKAMGAQHITEDMLHPFIKIVPSGILRLVECQTADYAYIKP
ncbi:MAG: DsrE family protein [Vagococcus sp.]|uniref:DsrE family protein n=1 Tax=Vagococcus sp. TaxID=1933889 RepID=UPI002FC58499